MNARINTEKLKTTLFCLFVYASIIVDTFRIVNNSFLHLGDAITTLFRNSVYILLFVLMLVTFYRDKKSRNTFTFLSGTYTILLILSFAVNSKIEEIIIDNLLIVFSRIIPAYVISSELSDFDLAISKIAKCRWLVLIYLLAFVSVGITNTRYYYMYVGYNLLYPTLILLFISERERLLDRAIAISSIVVIVLFCARGTSLVLIPSIAFFYILMISQQRKSKKRIAMIVILVMASIFMLVFLDDIFKALYSAFPSSRTLYYIMHGQIMDSSGRDNYYSAGIAELIEHPLLIRGVLGDRFFYGEVFGLSDVEGAFAHNVILEIMLQFGLFIGLFISALFCRHIIIAIISGIRSRQHNQIIMICSIVIPSVIISMTTASYLSSIETLLMLGICTSILRKTKGLSMRKRHEKDYVIRRVSTTNHRN